MLGAGGIIYGVPSWSEALLIIDTNKNTASHACRARVHGTRHAAGAARRQRSAVVWFTVWARGLAFQQADFTTVKGLGAGPKWWGGVWHPQTQRLFATPAFESYILVVDTKGGYKTSKIAVPQGARKWEHGVLYVARVGGLVVACGQQIAAALGVRACRQELCAHGMAAASC